MDSIYKLAAAVAFLFCLCGDGLANAVCPNCPPPACAAVAPMPKACSPSAPMPAACAPADAVCAVAIPALPAQTVKVSVSYEVACQTEKVGLIAKLAKASPGHDRRKARRTDRHKRHGT